MVRILVLQLKIQLQLCTGSFEPVNPILCIPSYINHGKEVRSIKYYLRISNSI